MDQRRAAGALLALVVCITATAAAPTVSNQTGLDLYDSSTEGCYYNFQHYGEGDRIMTNEPCLNCTCHNRMLMCYLRVCPFTKPIGQDCTVEKRADQCCPIVTCPDVPVDLLTSTTTSPAEYGGTGVGKLDKYGCSIHGKYFPEGSKVPPMPNKPCEHCYCIRNMTTCVMQECTLHVDGCTPIYHKDVCCPVRYSCDHPEDETLLLDDMTTTVRPTPGFLLTTTTLSPVTQMSQDCVHDDQIFSDGALIKTEKACEHCYCMKGDIVCVVQECGTPMENEGKNCTSQPPREGQCCPDTYICEGDEITTELPSEYSTQSNVFDDLTTRRVGVEGSGYRNEPDEPTYTEIPSLESESEGSGYEQPTEPSIQVITPGKEIEEETSEAIDDSHYGTTTLRTPTLEEIEKTTEPDKGLNTVPSDDDTLIHGYEPPVTEKETVIPEITDITKSPLEADDKEKTASPRVETTEREESSTPSVTSKLDEGATSTESIFRKDDGENTESYEDTAEKTTTRTIELDSGTSAQGLTTESETKTPFIEELEKLTTLSSDITEKDYDHTFAPKVPTTESILDVSTPVESKPSVEMTTATSEVGEVESTVPTVEKIDIPETTSPEENEIEDVATTLSPARIPGEGDCLLNEKTYRNNSEVPSYNACDTGCRCVSSIIKCDRIICSPPPTYMDNCQPTYDPPGSCCPTYVCHTGETMPPQPHSQMSGTESPASLPPIECHGDECEISKEKETPVDASQKPEGSDCGSGLCLDQSKPSTPEQALEKCDDGKCLPPTQPCEGAECLKEPVVEPIIVPVKDLGLCANEEDCKRIKPETTPCEGDQCKNTVACDGPDCSTDIVKQPVTPVQPLCDNEEECKQIKPDVPSCEGDGCSDIHKVCSGPECDSDISKPSGLPEQLPCENEEECKQTKPGDVHCEGDGCGALPVECTGSECTSDTYKPHVSEQPICNNEEECKSIQPETSSCEGEKCTTDLSKPTVEPVHKPEAGEDSVEPCTEQSCRRKETGEVEAPTPTTDEDKQSLGTESPLVEEKQGDTSTITQEMQTEVPEVHSTISEDNIDRQTGSEEDIKSPTPDDIATEAPKPEVFDVLEDKETTPIEEPKYTSTSVITVTEETRIGETDITKESVTEIPAVESHTEPAVSEITTTSVFKETDQTVSPQDIPDIEPTEGTLLSEDKQSETPQESSTYVPKQDENITEQPEQYTTHLQEDGKLPVAPTDEEFIQVSTVSDLESETDRSPQPDQDVTKTIEDLEKQTPEEEISTKSPASLEEEEIDTSPHQPTTAFATEVPIVTDSIDISKTTLSKEEDSDKETDTPTDIIDKTTVAQAVTEKISELITQTPDETQTTETPEKITESYDDRTDKPTSPQHDVEAVTEVQTTPSALFDEKQEPSVPTAPVIPEIESEKIDEGSGMSQVTISDMETIEPTEKPFTQGEDKQPSIPSENPEINEIEGPGEKTDAPVTKKSEIITESPDHSMTLESSGDGEVSQTVPPKPSVDVEDNVTEEQEISTEEPSLEKEPEDEKIPSEQFIPVYSETTPDSSSVHTEQATAKSDEAFTDEVTEKLDTDKESASESTERTDTVDTKPHEDEEAQVIDKQTTEYPTDHISEADLITQSEEITSEPSIITLSPDVEKDLEPTEDILGTRIKDEPSATEQDKKESTEKPDKYSTMPELSKTTLSSLDIKPTEQTTEQHATDVIMSITDSEHEKEVTETPEKSITEPTTESLAEEITKQPLSTKKTEETTESSQKETEGLQELPEKPQQEVTSSLEPIEKEEIPTTEKIEGISTDLLPKVTLTPEGIETDIQEETDKEVTSHDEITEIPMDLTTPAISPEKTPVEPQEPQDVTPSPQEKTSPIVEDDVTHEPEEKEPGIPHETVSATPSTDLDSAVPEEETTEKQEGQEEPIKLTTEVPAPVKQESATTESFVTQEPTKPDLVELEEHTHIPAGEVSTAYPLSETDEGTEKSTSAPSEQDESPVVSTDKPVERFGESSEEGTQPIPAVPEQKRPVPEEVPTTEKSDIERTTTLDELISMTMKAPISSDHTKLEEPEAQTEKPLGETEGKPEDERQEKPSESTETPELTSHEKPEAKPEETPTDKLDKESTEEPSRATTARPLELPTEETKVKATEKPLGESSEDMEQPMVKPAEEPTEVEKSSEEPLKEPTEEPLKEPTEKSVTLSSEEPAVKPLDVSTEKLAEASTEKPDEELSEIPTEKPEDSTGQRGDTPLEEPSKETTEEPIEEKPSEKPSLETTEKLQDETTEKTDEKLFEESSEKTSTEYSEEPTEKPEKEVSEQPLEKTTEEPSEHITEEPKEKPLGETTEKSAEEPFVEATEKPVDESLGEPTERPADEHSVEATEKPEKESSEESTDKPAEEPSVETTGVPEEVPLGKPTEKPDDEHSEEATTKPEEEPITEPTEKPTDETSEEFTRKPEEKPSEQPSEKPDKEPAEESTGKPEEQPLGETTEKPSEEPSLGATAMPEKESSKQPEEKPAETPAEKPAVESTEKPVEESLGESTDKPAEEPSVESTEKPEEQPLGEPTEKPTEGPSQEATEKSGEKPLEEPTEKPAGETSTETARKPDEAEPLGEPTDKPTKEPSDEEATEKPQEHTVDETTEKTTGEPSEAPEEKPLEEGIEKPTETTSEAEEKPLDQTSSKPTEEAIGEPTEKPVEEIADEQTRKPEGLPSEVTIVTPAQEPSEEQTEKPVETPSEETSVKPLEEPFEQTPMVETTVVSSEPTEKPHDETVEKTTDKSTEQAATPEDEAEEKPTHELEEKPPTEAVEKTTDKPEPVTEEKPQDHPSEPAPTSAPEIPKPGFNEVQPTDEIPDDDHFPTSGGTSGYGTEPDYDEDQTFGPGTCRYGGKVYVSAQQIPRDDPCDFCFCFRSDIICLQQSCPPPIHGCHEEPIQGFCCPRYECPVAMATTLNVTTTTTTTTTTLPPHFLPHAYKGAAQRRGCQIKGHTYKVGEVVRASSGPCLHCTCGGDGQMKCDPKACTPEPMLRQMIAAAVSAKRRR